MRAALDRNPARAAPPAARRPLALAGGALLLALALLAALAVALREPSTYDLGIAVEYGDPSTSKIGFHALERADDGTTYRWTRGYAFLQMPYAYRAAPAYLAQVRLRSANPAGPQPLTFLVNERPLVTVTPDAGYRVYRLALPPWPGGSPELRLGMQTAPFRPAGDARELGVIVTHAALAAEPARDWPLLLTLALGPLALLALLALRGAPAWHALAVAGAVGCAVALLALVARPAPLRPEWMAWAALLGAAAVALLARELGARLGLGVLGALVAFSGAVWGSWLSDDAFISFRYAQNLVAGHGLVYNIGERVEGYTNFLWTMLAALALALRLDIVLAAYAAGVALALAIVLATYALGRSLLGPAWALAAALLAATSQSLLVYTARGGGLETGLFALLVLLGSAAYLRARPVAAGLIFGLAALTRPEGVMILALTALHAAVAAVAALPPGRPGARQLVAAAWGAAGRMALAGAALVVPYFLWRFSYYGDLLPNTFYVKTGGGPRVWLRGLEYLGSFALDFGGPLLLLVPLALFTRGREGARARGPARLGAAEEQHRRGDDGTALQRQRGVSRTFVPSRLRAFVLAPLAGWPAYLLGLCAVYAAYVALVGGDHFPGHRFLVPLVPWLALLMAAGLARAYGLLARGGMARRLAPAALAVVLLAYGGVALGRSARYDLVLAGNDESLWLWAEIGAWMHDNAAPDESVAAMGAGAIAFYADRPVIDLLGLTERHIARVSVPEAGVGAAGHEKRDPAYVLAERRPTYIPRMWDDYFGPPGSLAGQYELITIRTRYGREVEMWRRVR